MRGLSFKLPGPLTKPTNYNGPMVIVYEVESSVGGRSEEELKYGD